MEGNKEYVLNYCVNDVYVNRKYLLGIDGVGTKTEFLLTDSNGKAICSVAKEYGLIVCPECHDKTFNNTDAFLKIHRDIDCENFWTYFQSRYTRLEHDLDRIDRTLPYIESVHISFSEQSREQFPKSNPQYINSLLEKSFLLILTLIFLWNTPIFSVGQAYLHQ